MVDFDKISMVIYYAQINNCEVTDGPLADLSRTIVIADSGTLGNLNKTPHKFYLVYCSLSRVWGVMSLCGGLPHLCQDIAELFTLPLGTDVCAQAALQELQGALVL